jgi:hypothetical protein
MMPQANLPLPAWTGVLQAAEAWGCPPWEVTGERPPNRVLWLLRRGAYEREVNRAARDKQKHHG